MALKINRDGRGRGDEKGHGARQVEGLMKEYVGYFPTH